MTPIPQSVIDKDHDLDKRAARSQEALARHRWEQTLDPTGPRHTFAAYGRAVGRDAGTVSRSANAWQLLLDHAASNNPAPGAALTIQDAERTAAVSVERQDLHRAIAKGSGRPLAHVARGDNTTTRNIIHQAQARAERRGTDPVDEARDIAAKHRQTTEAGQTRRQAKADRSGLRYVAIEGHIAYAQRRLREALKEAELVEFSDEEMELLRISLDNLRAVLNLLDLRLAGTPDIDWDAELSRLGGDR